MKLTKKQTKMAENLSTLQKKIVINLVGSDMGQREAYVAAGGTAKTEKSQDASCSEIMAIPKVRAFYESLIKSAAAGAVLTKQKALEILSTSAKVSIADVCEFVEIQDGIDRDNKPIMKTVWKVKDLKDIKLEIARCIKSVTITAQGPKIELYDSHGAIKQLSDMIGWNVPRKTQISGDADAPIETKMIVTFVEAEKK